MTKSSEYDDIAINGKLRVEVHACQIQFWSEFDGWVATVGHTVNGDGLMLAEAQLMADLWNKHAAKAARKKPCDKPS